MTNSSSRGGWHTREATRSLYYGLRRHLRVLLRLPLKATAPVVQGPIDVAVARYLGICTRLRTELGPGFFRDKLVCEIGPGDSLATAALALNLSARHVH